MNDTHIRNIHYLHTQKVELRGQVLVAVISGCATIPQIEQFTGSSTASVRNYLRDLVEFGFVLAEPKKERGPDDPERGPLPKLYRVNPAV
jgi:hypothetical protein